MCPPPSSGGAWVPHAVEAAVFLRTVWKDESRGRKTCRASLLPCASGHKSRGQPGRKGSELGPTAHPLAGGASESLCGQCGQWASAGVDVLSPVVHSRLRSRRPDPLIFALIILTKVHFSALVFLFR